MDFLKAKVDAAKRAAKEQVNELRQGALELAEDLAGYKEAGKKSGTDGTKELEFKDGPLGFRLEGTVVISVEPGSQADRLGVEAGDRLAAVAGYAVPDFEPDDFEGEQRAMKLVKKWLKEMPRPSVLSFVAVHCAEVEPSEEPPTPPPVPGLAASAAALAAVPPRCRAPAPSPEPPVSRGRAEAPPTASDSGDTLLEADAASDQTSAPMRSGAERQDRDASPAAPTEPEALQVQLRREREERQQLVAELQRSRTARLQANARLESLQDKYQKRIQEFEGQLRAAREEGRKTLLAASAGEADSFSALESSEAKNAALEEDVARLRQALDAAHGEAAGSAARQAAEIEDLHSRAAAAEQRAEVLVRELRGLGAAHEAELELARGEREELERRHKERLADECRRGAAREAQLKQELAEAKKDFEMAERRALEAQLAAHAAASEAAAAVMEASAVRLEAAARADGSADRARDAAVGAADVPYTDEDVLWEARRMPASPHGLGGDSAVLHERIDVLEKRCASLQKKLNSRPVMSNPTDVELGEALRPAWELSAVALLGPKAGAALVVLHALVDAALRKFTRRLLNRGALLWLFYAHLIFLYAVAASSYAEVLPLSDGSTVDITLKQEAAMR